LKQSVYVWTSRGRITITATREQLLMRQAAIAARHVWQEVKKVRRAATLLSAFLVLASLFIVVPAAAQEQGELVITNITQSNDSQADINLIVAVQLRTVTGGTTMESPASAASVGFFVGGQLIGSTTTGSDGTASVPYHFTGPGSVVVVVRANRPPYTMTSASYTASYSPVSSPSPTATPSPSAQTPSVIVVPGGEATVKQEQGTTTSAATATVNESALSAEGISGALNSFMSDWRWILSIAAIILAACYVILTIYIRRAR
jgi:hypothetical protein